MEQKYSEIIKNDRPISLRHSPMPLLDRAAQFAPFEALNGHESALNETARLTDNIIDIDEYVKNTLNTKLKIISQNIESQPEVTFIYFRPDTKKSGGAYITVTGYVKEIDEYSQTVVLSTGWQIPINYIYEIDSEIFSDFEDI